MNKKSSQDMDIASTTMYEGQDSPKGENVQQVCSYNTTDPVSITY